MTLSQRYISSAELGQSRLKERLICCWLIVPSRLGYKKVLYHERSPTDVQGRPPDSIRTDDALCLFEFLLMVDHPIRSIKDPSRRCG